MHLSIAVCGFHRSSKEQLLAADVASGKVKAPATAEELAMLPPDVKAAPSFLPHDTLLLCLQALNHAGPFAVRLPPQRACRKPASGAPVALGGPRQEV